jgi:hypothetical protein
MIAAILARIEVPRKTWLRPAAVAPAFLFEPLALALIACPECAFVLGVIQ